MKQLSAVARHLPICDTCLLIDAFYFILITREFINHHLIFYTDVFCIHDENSRLKCFIDVHDISINSSIFNQTR